MEYKIDKERNLLYIKENNKWIKYCFTYIECKDKKLIIMYCKKTFFNLFTFGTFNEELKFLLCWDLHQYLYNSVYDSYPFEKTKRKSVMMLLSQGRGIKRKLLNHEETLEYLESYKVLLKLSQGL